MKKENIIFYIAVAMFICACLFFCGFLIKEIQYNKEHPCIETCTQTECFTYDKCVGGIMAPGFCITEEETVCRETTYCVKRK